MAVIHFTEDTHERLSLLVKEKLPWLIIGLIGGTLASFLVSSYEEVLMKNISLAFFVPIIVYMSDAVGNQTETMYVRILSKHEINFWAYLLKEIMLGLCLGTVFGVIIGLFSYLWLGSIETSLTVGIAMFLNITIAPAVALIVPEVLFKEHLDPALGAGPLKTVLQDIMSLFIYFFIASIIIF